MRLLRGLKEEFMAHLGAVATIGNFDGVHVGHQALLKHLREQSAMLGLPSIVFLFEPHAREYFSPQDAPARLSSLREKLTVFRQFDIDVVCCLKFDAKLASMSPTEFAQFIFQRFNLRYLVVGDDFRFGKERRGDGALLKALGQQNQCDVYLFKEFLHNQKRVRSTEVRKALTLGQLSDATELLGRRYSVLGRVVRGNGIGRTFGIPTANLNLRRKKVPMTGVFVVEVKLQDLSVVQGVANIGFRPTIDGRKLVLEIHLFDFDEVIYGQWLQVFFLYKLRDEKKFASIDQLIEQIREDIRQSREILRANFRVNL